MINVTEEAEANFRTATSIKSDLSTYAKLSLNYLKNIEQDHTKLIDEATKRFSYEDCKDQYWNPEEYSLLYGTPLWDQASSSQKRILNHLYWVAYYAQIISAEIATILLNQVSAAGLYGVEDFRLVCDTLDLESSQERAHINAFKTIGEAVEMSLLGERLFTYPMRSMFTETMIFQDTNTVKRMWKHLQLKSFLLVAADNPFIASQYFTVRGLRTLNGKIVQHRLASPYAAATHKGSVPIPAQVSHYHFMDESFHFNSSLVISHDVIRSLKKPGKFERWVANTGLWGCQKDHFHFSTAIKGIFWYDPALFSAIYKLLRSPIFGFDDQGAKQMLKQCFAEENQGAHESFALRQNAVNSYKAYLDPLDFVNKKNKSMQLMRQNSLEAHLAKNKTALSEMWNSL